ncbi:MAG: cysteine desulfurase [Candidatus Nealsonbacteria bacterium]|nr:cysteine desulfurase [Candidatus Nealsonbacteria bacterium]
MPKIYLDYASTTPVDPKVMEAMKTYFKKDFGNPSSIHSFGQKAIAAIDDARQKVASFLGCELDEVIFTGSATEANNLAIFGLIKKGDHIITTQIEHHAILEPCQKLEKEGVEVTYLPVDKDGLVKVSDVEKAIKLNTILVSIMYANNEIGTIQPIAEIGELLKARKNKIYFHTDAVQAANYLDCDVKKLGVDLLTLSGHKIYGPKGVGALFVKKGILLNPLIYGGGQEQGRRSGTENVPAIVGLGAAIEETQNPKIKINIIRIRQFRDKLIKTILKIVSDSKLNGSPIQRLPNNINVTIDGAEGEAMVIALDQKGIAVSTGSACSAKSLEPSHVLLALGLSHEEAHGSLRITLGRYTTQEEITKFLKVLPQVIQRLRQISGYK